MRHAATDAEMRLWSRLRGRRLGKWKFRRQHPVGGFILDFYCAEAGLGIELDGGGHALPEQAAYDKEREQRLAECGVRVLRFWDDQALKETDTVLEVVLKALDDTPHPTLSPKGERAGQAIPSPQGGRVDQAIPSPQGGRVDQAIPSPWKGEGQG